MHHRCAHYQALMRTRRDLHDQIGSSLAAMAISLELAWQTAGQDCDGTRDVLAELHSDITELIGDVRRIVSDCEAQHGAENFEAALREMIDKMSRPVASRLKFSLYIDPSVRQIREDVSSAAFWIVREALVNVLKHAMAQHCSVSLLVRDGKLYLRVADDGSNPPARPRSGGSGLDNMSGRAAERGGWCTAGPALPNGFAVVACFPLATAPA
jgi:signal transduction histidine kinase